MKNAQQKIKYFVYPRKSSEAEDRQVASIEAQIEELTKLARGANLEVLDILSEAQSAKAPGRPIFNDMIQRIYKGEAQGIICWKLDRLARNPVDGGTINWMLQQGVIQHIQTFERSYYPTDNVLMMSVEFGMANQFVRDLSTNVKRGLRNKAKAGWLPSVAPAGYLNTPDRNKGYKTIVEDPERFPLVRRMWDLMLTGNYTAPRIWKIANTEWGYRTVQRRNEGGKPMSRSAIYKLFTSPFYYGYFEFPVGSGNWIKGGHKPMITEEEYQRVQVILGRKGKPAPKSHLFAFTGLMRCAVCGSAVTAEEKFKHQKNGNVHHYIYYHCTKKKNPNCLEKSVEVKELHRQIDGALEGITVSEEFKNWAIKYLHEIRTNEATTQHIAFQNKQKDLEEVSEQLGSLLLKYTSVQNKDGKLISDAEYDSLKSTLLKRKESLESALRSQGSELEQWVELSERTFNFARYARAWFEKGDLDVKRAILACLGSNLLVEGGKLKIQLRPVFQTLFGNTSKVGAVTVSARTSENPIAPGVIGENLVKSTSWLPG
ncbi:MAG: recombinase family protein [Candidatus Brennerbacteria bacterium]|nr:recombinase family protein [Candidatus Brennerbacteria bacterium]